MSNFAKIRALCLWKRRNFLILLTIETILIITGIIGLFGKNGIYEYNIDEAIKYFGDYSEAYGGIMASEADENSGYLVDFAGISLPRGTYRVQLHYVTDTDFLNHGYVTEAWLESGYLRTDGAFFFSGLNHSNFEMWLLRDSNSIVVSAYYDGQGMLAVQGLTIYQTNEWNRMALFLTLCLCSIINAVYCYVQYDRVYEIPVKNKTVTFLLGLIVLMASIPIMVDYTLTNGDLIFHLMRVEGIKDGILNGQFPIRISPEWQQGYGYAAPVFYGETFLYVAAALRLIGFTVTTSYRLFMFAITVATVLIAYYCFKKIFREAYIGVFCSMLYTLSIFRIYWTYFVGAFGMCLSIMLLPLICYGFFRIFTQDIHEESYKRSWIPLSVGFALLLQSHTLSCEIVGGFSVLLCVVMWKKVFRKNTFMALIKAVISAVLSSAWFLVPFVDYMSTGNFVIHNVSARTIQFRGLLVSQLLLTYFQKGETVFFDAKGVFDSPAVGLGSVLIIALLFLAALFITGKSRDLSEGERRLGVIAGVFSVLAMLMSLNLFPWDRIQAINGFTATLVSSIQVPARFLIIANAGLTVVAGIVVKYFMIRGSLAVKIYVCGSVLLVAVGSLYLQENALNRSYAIRRYGSEGVGTGYVSGGEYLPYGADTSLFVPHDPTCTGSLKAEEYEKLSLGATAYMSNSGNKTESASFALLYYKGYHAFGENGQELSCYSGENFEVTVDIPAGYEGSVRVRFVSPWYWRAGEAVTLLTVVMMLFFLWIRGGRQWWQRVKS